MESSRYQNSNNEIKMLLKIKIFMPYQKRMVKEISRIGSTFGKTNRVLIDTDQHLYIIYTQNDQKVYNGVNKINYRFIFFNITL